MSSSVICNNLTLYTFLCTILSSVIVFSSTIFVVPFLPVQVSGCCILLRQILMPVQYEEAQDKAFDLASKAEGEGTTTDFRSLFSQFNTRS
jgi:hypothetical protein